MRPAAGSSNSLSAMQGQQQQQQAMMAAQMAAASSAVRPGHPGVPQGFNMQLLQQQQQQQILALQHQQQQQAAAVAAGAGNRAPSPAASVAGSVAGSVQQPPPMAPGATQLAITVPLQHPQTGAPMLTSVPLNPGFVMEKRQFIMQHIGNPKGHPLIYQEYAIWDQRRRAANTSAQPAAKRPKVEAAASASAAARPAGVPMTQQQLAAMAGARPPLPPGMMAPGMAQVTAAQAAAAAQLRLHQSMVAKRAQFPPIVRPVGEDERQYVPKPRLQALVKQVGQGMSIASAKTTDEAEAALRAVAEDFVSGAVSFAVAMARRRKSGEVEPADLMLHLQRKWNIQVPGFSSRDVKPYQRQQSSADHQRRMAAVRRAMAVTASAALAAGGVATPAAAAGASPAGPEGVGAASAAAAAPAAAATAGAKPGGGAGTAAAGGGGNVQSAPAAAQQQQRQVKVEDDDMP